MGEGQLLHRPGNSGTERRFYMSAQNDPAHLGAFNSWSMILFFSETRVPIKALFFLSGKGQAYA